MKSILTGAVTIAMWTATAHLQAATARLPTLLTNAAQADQDEFSGTWQGETGSGRPVVLELKVAGKQLTGRLTLAQQTAEITEGKVEGKTFSLTTGPLDGRNVACTGRRVGEEIELTVKGVGSPLMLKRAK